MLENSPHSQIEVPKILLKYSRFYNHPDGCQQGREGRTKLQQEMVSVHIWTQLTWGVLKMLGVYIWTQPN